MTPSRPATLQPLAAHFAALGVQPPTLPSNAWPRFDEQVAAILDLQPAVFSFVFGIPQAAVIEACRGRGIVTAGAVTTVEEARAMAAAGVDIVVASGLEAGGHRPSFLRSAEASLMGTLSLIPQVADAVSVPIIAAGGIGDGRGIAAALALGAQGVQIGTAFLACEESNALPEHRDALKGPNASQTVLTRAFSGRLGRGLPNTVAAAFDVPAATFLPYPLQGQLVSALRDEALRQGRIDLVAFWSGQSAPLIRHARAAALFQDLVDGTERALGQAASPRG